MKDFQNYATKHLGFNSSSLDKYSKQLQKGPLGSMTNVIAEEKPMNVSVMDVFSRLMCDRIVFLGTEITSDVANIINAQLLYLDHVEPGKEITIYINSPGGSVYDGLGIYDTMQLLDSKIKTVNTGLAASMASVILAGGSKGKRYSLKHARVMSHQPLGSLEYSQATDIEITSREMQRLKKEMYEILAAHSGASIATIMKDFERDYWMTAAEAKNYGFIDHILTKRNKNTK